MPHSCKSLAAPPPLPPVLDLLEPEETIIDVYYMEQLLAHGIALGRQEGHIDDEGLRIEAQVSSMPVLLDDVLITSSRNSSRSSEGSRNRPYCLHMPKLKPLKASQSKVTCSTALNSSFFRAPPTFQSFSGILSLFHYPHCSPVALFFAYSHSSLLCYRLLWTCIR
jgi:hypothetical protein